MPSVASSFITGPYRMTAEVAEFTGDALDDEGMPRQGWKPHRIRIQESWHEADGTQVTDPARIWELEEQFIIKERE